MTNPIDLKALQASSTDLGKGEPVVRPVRGLRARGFQPVSSEHELLFALLRNIGQSGSLKTTPL